MDNRYPDSFDRKKEVISIVKNAITCIPAVVKEVPNVLYYFLRYPLKISFYRSNINEENSRR